MEFEKFIRQRRKLGIQTYGRDSHKLLTHNELIIMAQEELGDLVNYLRWLKKKGTNLTFFIPSIRLIYNTLEFFKY